MRAIAAASVLAALLIAAPAGAAKARDKSRSCQAGKAVATKTSVLGSKKRFAVVACEQPPKSNLLAPGTIAKATASALSALG